MLAQLALVGSLRSFLQVGSTSPRSWTLPAADDRGRTALEGWLLSRALEMLLKQRKQLAGPPRGAGQKDFVLCVPLGLFPFPYTLSCSCHVGIISLISKAACAEMAYIS